jgi:hypothetical protein
MILICDFCNSKKREIIKIPNAFIIQDDYILFPSDPMERYTNMCLDCMNIDRGVKSDM